MQEVSYCATEGLHFTRISLLECRVVMGTRPRTNVSKHASICPDDCPEDSKVSEHANICDNSKFALAILEFQSSSHAETVKSRNGG